MKILLLSLYYEPDIGPGALRNTSFARALSEQIDEDGKIDVITTMPSRYGNYRRNVPEMEFDGKIRIRRISVRPHSNSVFGQAFSYLSYARAVIKQVHEKPYDLLYVSSSRLMTAVLGAIISRKYNIPLYLDLRDIFVETVRDVYAHNLLNFLSPVFIGLEKYAITSAKWINLVSPGFESHFRSIAPEMTYRFFTNGFDDIGVMDKYSFHVKSRPMEIVYAGNIGEGQGLEHIIPRVARKLPRKWKLVIIGDGSRREVLKKATAGLLNVYLHNPLSREDLMKRYSEASVLFLHLNNYRAFEKVIPSKIFEYAATGLPIIAGVKGVAASFIGEHVENAALFQPCDADGFLEALNKIRLQRINRFDFKDRFSRKKISREMACDLLDDYLSYQNNLGHASMSGDTS